MRTSIKTLETICEWINAEMGNPETPYSRDENGRMRGNIGNYHISQAYGGVCVHRMENDGGGVSTPIWSGHIPKRDAEICMRAFYAGLTVKKS